MAVLFIFIRFIILLSSIGSFWLLGKFRSTKWKYVFLLNVQCTIKVLHFRIRHLFNSSVITTSCSKKIQIQEQNDLDYNLLTNHAVSSKWSESKYRLSLLAIVIISDVNNAICQLDLSRTYFWWKNWGVRVTAFGQANRGILACQAVVVCGKWDMFTNVMGLHDLR